MTVFRSLEDIPASFGPSLVSVGNFDGVHRAHVRVLHEIADRSRQQGAQSIAVTFEPHPTRLLRPDSGLKLLTPTQEKLRLLEGSAIDAVLLLSFTRELSLMTPRDFVQHILRDRLKAVELHEGYNFHFGYRASGDVQLLGELGRELGFRVVAYPEMRVRGESVSSTRIRELIREGQVARARALLARPFSLRSTSTRGRGIGAQQTVPTINFSPYAELVPANGVYITRTRVENHCFDSVTNIGNRPTFGTDSFAIETHLLDFQPFEMAPETQIELSFLARLRDEIKFSSVQALREQIQRDIAKARHYFGLMRHTGTSIEARS